MQLTNCKGELLYILISSQSNDIYTTTYVGTWEKVLEKFNKWTEETDNEALFRKVVKKDIDSISARCTLVENKKGWGSDYIVFIEIKQLYYWNN